MATSQYSLLNRLAPEPEDTPPVYIPGAAINDITDAPNTVKIGGALAYYLGYDQETWGGVVRLTLSPNFIPANKNDKDEAPAPIAAALNDAPAEAHKADNVKQKFENRVPFLARMDVHRDRWPAPRMQGQPRPNRRQLNLAHSQPVHHEQPAPRPPSSISISTKYFKLVIDRFLRKKALELVPALAVPFEALDFALDFSKKRRHSARRGNLKLECALNDAPQPKGKTLEDEPELEPKASFGPLKLALFLAARPL